MAARDHDVQVYRGGQRQDRYEARVDADNLVTVRRELHAWLEEHRVPEGQWLDQDWRITVDTPTGVREVRA